jgi:hypothetical protein
MVLFNRRIVTLANKINKKGAYYAISSSLEKLHFPLVLLRRGEGFESSQVPSLPGLWVQLP